MTTRNEDVLRVNDTEANLTTNLKSRMLAYATDTGKFAAKVGGIMKYVSNDALQALLAGTQTFTGAKSFDLPIGATGGIVIGKETILTPKIVTSVTGGTTILDTSDTSYILLNLADTGAASGKAVGLSAGSTYGQRLLITSNDSTSAEIDAAVPSGASLRFPGFLSKVTLDLYESAEFVWTLGETIAGSTPYWKLISTTGALS